jgi:hypothetical protein
MAAYQARTAPARPQAAALEPAYRAILERAQAMAVGLRRRLDGSGDMAQAPGQQA